MADEGTTQIAATPASGALADRASRAALAERANAAAAADPNTASVPAGVARSVGQGALFGFADEAEAAVRALWDTAPGEDYSDAYLRLRNDVRGQLDQFRAERPVLALGSELAGGFAVPGIGVGKGVAGAVTTGGRILRGAAGGAAAGGLFGAGIAEEASDIPREVVRGAAFGAAAGGAIPAAVAGGRAVVRTGRAALAPERAASQRIGQAIARDEMTPQQIAGAVDEARRLGKPATAADVGGEAVRRELETAVQSPGAAAEIAERVLVPRNKQQLTRLSRDLVKGTGVGAETVEDAIEKTMRVRSNAAGPVYAKAMDFSAELNDDIVETYEAAIKTPLGKRALSKARLILNKGAEERPADLPSVTIGGRALNLKQAQKFAEANDARASSRAAQLSDRPFLVFDPKDATGFEGVFPTEPAARAFIKSRKDKLLDFGTPRELEELNPTGPESNEFLMQEVRDLIKVAKERVTVDKFDEAPLMERIDAFKRGLDDVIGSAQRGGEKSIARKALQVKGDLLELVDTVNPDYRKARKIWESGAGYLDAIDRGREVLRPNFTAAKLQREFEQLSDANQEAFRIGVVDAVITRMRQQSAKEPNLLRLIRSPEMRDKLKAVMTPEQGAKFDEILDIEESMFRTASQARGGSPTAKRLAAQAEQEKQLQALRGLDFVLELAITPMRAVFLRGLPAVPRAARERMIAQQNAIISRRLLSADAGELLNIPQVRPGPSRVAGGSAIPPAVISGRRPSSSPEQAAADNNQPTDQASFAGDITLESSP